MAPRQWALGQTQVDDLLSGGSRYVLSEPGQAWRGANGQMGKLIAGENRRVGPSKNHIGTFGTLVPTIHKPTPYSAAGGIFLSWNPRSIIAYVSRTRMWVATSFSVRPGLPRLARRTR